MFETCVHVCFSFHCCVVAECGGVQLDGGHEDTNIRGYEYEMWFDGIVGIVFVSARTAATMQHALFQYSHNDATILLIRSRVARGDPFLSRCALRSCPYFMTRCALRSRCIRGAPATRCFLRVITFDVFGCVLKHSEKESRDGGMNRMALSTTFLI